MKIEAGIYTLCSDAYCMWITKKVEVIDPKTKKPNGKYKEEKVAGYSTTVPSLLRSFRDHEIMAVEAESLDELLEALKDAYDAMTAVVKYVEELESWKKK